MATQGEARMSPSKHRRLQSTTTATIESVDTPFVRVSEPGLTTQKVAARPMQAHDEAHKAVSCREGEEATNIDVAYGDVDVGSRMDEIAKPNETGFGHFHLAEVTT